MDKIKLVDIMNELLKSKHDTDNYTDGVVDMYNSVLKAVEQENQ